MNPQMFAPTGSSIPLVVNGQTRPVNYRTQREFNNEILSRTRRARSMGMSEDDIQANIAQDIDENRQLLMGLPTGYEAPTQMAAQPKKKGNLLTRLLPTIGGVLGTAGLAAAPVTGGASLLLAGLGGVLGSVGGKMAQNALEDEKVTSGLGGEAAWGALGGAGKLVKGGRALMTGADIAGDAARAGRVATAGSRLRQSTRGLDDAGKIFESEGERQVANSVMSAVGLKGSARAQFRNVDEAISTLNKRASTVLASGKPTNALEVTTRLTQRAGTEIVSDRPAFTRALTEANAQLTRMAGKNGQITPTQLYQFKQDVAGRLNSAFKKLQTGTSLSPEEQAFMSVWKGIDDEIIRLAPGAKRLTKAQSILIQSRPVLDKAANQKANFMGFPLGKAPASVMQTGTDTAGRIIERAGGVTRGKNRLAAYDALGLTGRAKQAIPGQVLPRLLTGQYGDNLTPEQASAMSDFSTDLMGSPETADFLDRTLSEAGVDTTAVGDLVARRAGVPGAGGDLDEATLSGNAKIPRDAIAKALQEDLIHNGGKNMQQILTLADYMNMEGDFAPKEDEGQELSAEQQKGIVKLQQAENQLDELEATLAAAGGGQGRYKGTVATLLGKADIGNPYIRAYDETRKSAGTTLARAFGEVGAMAEGDVQRAVSRIPQITDRPEVAAIKLQQLRQILRRNMETVYNAPKSKGGMTIDADALAAMGGM